MPTGYTYAVQEGKITTLREFALRCARGMGACITMRDEPNDAPLPERFEPSTNYYDERIAFARATLSDVANLSPEACEERAAAAHGDALAAHVARGVKRAAEKRRYQDMLAAAREWTTDAEGIREFMIAQLEESIRFDCSDRYDDAPARQTAEQWRDATLASASQALGYSLVEREKEISRTEARNAWLAKLRASLPSETPNSPPSPAA